jgi:type IV secretion system protein VirB6
MAGFCASPAADAPLIQGLLGSVDCNVQTMSASAYSVLSGPNSQVGIALTSLLTIYVAVLGLRLLMGLAPLRIGDITLTALKLGVVLALATNWPTYQTLVFDTLFHGPEQLAGNIIDAIQPSDSLLRGNPFDALQVVYDQLQAAAAFFGRTAGAIVTSPLMGGAPFAAFSLNAASNLMLLSTVGVVLAAKIVLALLLALGPVFVGLLLFDSTRGVFEGWLRASLAFAFAPLFATLALVVQLVLVEPHLIALAEMMVSGKQNLPAATAVFLLSLIGAGVSLAGLIGAAVIAFGFKLPPRLAPSADRAASGGAGPAAAGSVSISPLAQQPRAEAVAAAAMAMDRRDVRLIERGSQRRNDIAPGAPPEGRRPLGQTHRRTVQPRRAASRARRDQ